MSDPVSFNLFFPRNLSSKKSSLTASYQFLVISLGDARQSTPIISKTLNPTWNTTFDFPILPGGVPLLECICWDKDRFGKDYMGEFDIVLEEIFPQGEISSEEKWFELSSRRKRRGTNKVVAGGGLHEVSGEICLAFEVWDPMRRSAEEVGKKEVSPEEKEDVSRRFREYLLGISGGDAPAGGVPGDDDLEVEDLDLDELDDDDGLPDSLEDDEEELDDGATFAPSLTSQYSEHPPASAPSGPVRNADISTKGVPGKASLNTPQISTTGHASETALDPEKRRRRLRLANLKRRSLAKRAYEFSGAKDGVSGIVFMEVIRATDLPPEKNVTRTSFDMDPFVVTSLGRKTLRTRVIRHNLNPVWEEKMVFQVMKHEQGFYFNFTVMDWDKLSGNDFVAKAEFPVQNLVLVAPVADSETGLYDMSGSNKDGARDGGNTSASGRGTSPSNSFHNPHGLTVLTTGESGTPYERASGSSTPISFTGASSAPPSSPARSRFRFGLSRSTSSNSLNKQVQQSQLSQQLAQQQQLQQQSQQQKQPGQTEEPLRRRSSFTFRKQRVPSSPGSASTPALSLGMPVGSYEDTPDYRAWGQGGQSLPNHEQTQGQAASHYFARRGSRGSNSPSPPLTLPHGPRRGSIGASGSNGNGGGNNGAGYPSSASPTGSQSLLSPVPQGAVMQIPESLQCGVAHSSASNSEYGGGVGGGNGHPATYGSEDYLGTTGGGGGNGGATAGSGTETGPGTGTTGTAGLGLGQPRNVNQQQSHIPQQQQPPEVSLSPPPPEESEGHVSTATTDNATGSANGGSGGSGTAAASTPASTPAPAPAGPSTTTTKSAASSISNQNSQYVNSQSLNVDDDLRTYVIPLELANKERWEDKHFPELVIKAKYMPYRALRQQFWRVMLKQYDTDDVQGRVSRVELVSMLDTLGSTLKESTIDGFFERFRDVNLRDAGTMDLTFDQAVICLEDTLQMLQKKQVTLQEKKVEEAAVKKGGKRTRLRRRLTGSMSSSQRELAVQQAQQHQQSQSQSQQGGLRPTERSPSSTSLSQFKTDSSVFDNSQAVSSLTTYTAYSPGAVSPAPSGAGNENAVPQVVLSKSLSTSSNSSKSSAASVRSRLRSLSSLSSRKNNRERSQSASESQGARSLAATAAASGSAAGSAAGSETVDRMSPLEETSPGAADDQPQQQQENIPPGGQQLQALTPDIPDDQKSIASSTRSVLNGFHPDDLADIQEKNPHLHTDSPVEEAHEEVDEHVVEISQCPLCHRPRLSKRSDADIITHLATCASQDWRSVNNLVMGGFVTSSQAQRKWYSKVITKIGYGGYALGANSANILVQDRITGQISEEKMSVYVRLGIRLLYKGLKSKEMEKHRIRKLLKSLSVKQGKKYDDPASAGQIESFIRFHRLNMNEVALPIEKFKTFNEFFYRALKPGARPCCAPDEPRVIVSPADCRTVVFDTIHEASRVWVKGREFSIERLLGSAYPEDVSRYTNGGGLGVFRLAPQDYHRFHVPVDGVMGEPKTIEGEYYTVNPMAIRSALDVYGENVRVIVPIDTETFGRVMFICVGAMMVGSTVITRKTGEHVRRAEELGYFKFGGSTVLLLFEPGVMKFDSDLSRNSAEALETLVRVGMSIGHAPDIPEFRTEQGVSDPSELTPAEREAALRRIEGNGEESEERQAEMQTLPPTPVHTFEK